MNTAFVASITSNNAEYNKVDLIELNLPLSLYIYILENKPALDDN
jgi:hypothetical protein